MPRRSASFAIGAKDCISKPRVAEKHAFETQVDDGYCSIAFVWTGGDAPPVAAIDIELLR